MQKLFVLLACSIFAFTQATAQRSEYYRERVKNLTNLDYTICDEYNVKIEQGETGYAYRKFESDVSYRIVAFSDDADVTDVDLYVYDDDGELYKKDDDSEDIAIVEFKPWSGTREFKVVVKNVKSSTPNDESYVYFLIGCK